MSRKQYIENFKQDKNVTITMTLDMEKHTLSYTMNDKDSVVIKIKLDKNRYRMVVIFLYDNHSVELLRTLSCVY